MATLRANKIAALVRDSKPSTAANSTFSRRNNIDSSLRSALAPRSQTRRAATAPTVRATARTSKPVMASCQAGIDIASMAAHREAEVAFGVVSVLGRHVPVDVILAGRQRRERDFQEASIACVDLRLAPADHFAGGVLDHEFVEQRFEVAVEPDLHDARRAGDGRADGGLGALGESVCECRARCGESRDGEHAEQELRDFPKYFHRTDQEGMMSSR